MLGTGVDDFFDLWLEAFVEGAQHGGQLLFAFCYLVELVLHLGGEVIVHDLREVLLQEVVDHDADVGGDEFAPLRSGHFCLGLSGDGVVLECVYGIGALGAGLVALDHVLALLDGGDEGGVGRRTSDAQLFQFVHEAGLGVAWWSL